ncbi:Protease inhibitor/seed storage/LTP family [Musa troglodytarum]|uniref:Protease inhibitor/seed storage/LTP family n=1 Tax=Musa troglodytarum TaxID=320322 RepID=A0A9E7IA09_9LILI|nr:Protease inhibitor/seed storage/LTP family [Musa troglodytarum]
MEFLRTAAMAILLLSMTFESGEAVCNMTQEGFDACKPSVTPPNPPPPSAACCKALGNADLQCLCSYKNSPLLPLLGIDPGLAMTLPPKCNLKLPANC